MKLDREAFRAWLAERPMQEFKTCSSQSCPLGKYLNASVWPDYIFVGKVGIETPGWAREFIDTVDDIRPLITGADALAILNRMPTTEACRGNDR